MDVLDDGAEGGPKTYQVGACWTVPEFVQQSLRAEHPHDHEVRVDPQTAATLVKMAEKGPAWVVAYRSSELKFLWKNLNFMENYILK